MVFSSLFFVFAFLPTTIGLYYFLGDTRKNLVLLFASLFFYAWGEPVYILLMCVSILINYLLGLKMNKGEDKKKYLLYSLIFNIGLLVYFKYLGFIEEIIFSTTGLNMSLEVPKLPLGISFYTFQTMSYVIDVYKGKVKVQRSLMNFALYITMFPQLVAGPIVNYGDIELQLENRRVDWNKFNLGFQRFLLGLGKKVLLANKLGLLWAGVKATDLGEISVLTAWFGILAFSLQIYFDFSGYSDMAIGLGKIFGFDFKENFNYPYISKSISEFWRRWHISLGSWFREYVYFPLGGSRVKKLGLIRNLLIVWVLTGIWHGASWNFMVWGLYFGVIIVLEKFFMEELLLKLPKLLRHVYTILLLIIGWIIFEFTSLGEICKFIRLILGFETNLFIDSDFLSWVRVYGVFLILGIVGVTPIPKKIANWVKHKNLRVYEFSSSIYSLILIFLSTVYMVGSTYNPFIYFRF